jgi:hypothetical protein
MVDRVFRPLNLGQLPVAKIRECLGIRLQAGMTVFSAKAQTHAYQRHPDDFEICLSQIAAVVRAPDFVGQGPHQNDGIELIGRSNQAKNFVLVAVKLRPDRRGNYVIASTYLVDKHKIERRLRKGYLYKTK